MCMCERVGVLGTDGAARWEGGDAHEARSPRVSVVRGRGIAHFLGSLDARDAERGGEQFAGLLVKPSVVVVEHRVEGRELRSFVQSDRRLPTRARRRPRASETLASAEQSHGGRAPR